MGIFCAVVDLYKRRGWKKRFQSGRDREGALRNKKLGEHIFSSKKKKKGKEERIA